MRSRILPASTLQGEGRVAFAPRCTACMIQPCFNLERTTTTASAASISGLGFAYCEFTARNRGARSWLTAYTVDSAIRCGLRPSLAADNK